MGKRDEWKVRLPDWFAQRILRKARSLKMSRNEFIARAAGADGAEDLAQADREAHPAEEGVFRKPRVGKNFPKEENTQ